MRQGTKGAPPPRAVNVQVAVRCRPLNAREKSCGEREVLRCNSISKEIICSAPFLPRKAGQGNVGAGNIGSVKKTYVYDHVFGQEANQSDVYAGVVEPIVDEVLQGYNCTVFAYGQTGTGKTHTMEGRRDDGIIGMTERRLPDNAGIIPRSVKQIFDHLRSITDEHTVRVSHLEIYNEHLSDLLGPDEDEASDTLRVYEDSSKGTFVQGLDEVLVRNEEEIFAVLDKSANKRRTAETLMNKYSSRSHSVFTITIHIKESTPEGADLLKVGKLNLVDLAGSENVGRSGAVKGRAREAGNINQSLLTLGRVITSLVEKHPHVPYRDSKLTRLLQESLGGRNKTCIIATVTPGSSSSEETASTLEYAHRAKSIKNRPTVNQMIAKHVLLKEYTDEITKIRRELDACRAKNGIYLPPDEYERLIILSNQQKESISDLELRNEEYERINAQTMDKLVRSENTLFRTQSALAKVEDELSKTQHTLSEKVAELRTTTQERDEAHHLLGEHITTEKSLYSDGRNLSTTLDTAVSDVGELQNRLEARMNAENINSTELLKLQNHCASRLDDVQAMLHSYKSSQNTALSACRDQTADIATSVDSQVAKLTEKLDDMCDGMKELLAESARNAHKVEDSFAEKEKSAFESFESQYIGQEKLALELNKFIDVICSGISEQVATLKSQLSDVLGKTESSLSAQEQHLDKFVACQATLLTDLEGAFAQQLRAQDETVKHVQQSIGSAVERNLKQARQTEELVVQKVKDIMSSFLAETINSSSEILNTSEKHTTSMQLSARNLQSTLQQYGQTADKTSGEAIKHAKELKRAMRTDIGSGHSQAENQLNSVTRAVTDHNRASRQHIESMKVGNESARYELGQFAQLIRQERDERFAQSRAVSERFIAHMDSSNLSIRQNMQSSAENISSAVSTVSSELSKIDKSSNTLVEQVTTDMVPAVGSELKSFTLKSDEDAARAPPRRSWHYPIKLPRTRQYDILLEEYRREHGFDDIPRPQGLPNTNTDAFEEAEFSRSQAHSDILSSGFSEPETPDETTSEPGSDENSSNSQEQEQKKLEEEFPNSDASGCADSAATTNDDHVLTDTTNLMDARMSARGPISKIESSNSDSVLKRSGLRPPVRRSVRSKR